MISMKWFILFIVINVFTWNSNVHANNNDEPKNVYDLTLMTGSFVDMNDYKGNFILIIYLLTTNIKNNVDYKKLIQLAQTYNGKKLTVLVVVGDEIFKGAEYNQNSDILEKINGSNIEFVYDINARDLLKFMIEERNQLDSSSESNIFLVNYNGKVISEYKNSINEETLVYDWKPWLYADTMYELEVKNYKGDLVKMEKYKNNVLLVSFIRGLRLIEKEELLFQWMLNLALTHKNARFKILVFLLSEKKFYEMDPAYMISKINTITEVLLFKEDANSYVFRKLIISKLPHMNYYFKDELFVIDHRGSVFIQCEKDSGVKVIENLLKIMEEDQK